MDAIAILGGGKIGEALLSGLLRGDRTPSQIVVSEKHPERAAYLTETFGVQVTDVAAAVKQATTLLIAVKPQDIDTLLAEIAPAIETRHTVVSVAAGITTRHIERALPDGVAVVRCMPNTPALVDQAMTAVAPGAHADDEHLSVAEALLGAVGRVVRVPEHQLDAVTALSGSGPAYFFYLVEQMIRAGVELGLTAEQAHQLATRTALGAAKMLTTSTDSPQELRRKVTSPGGTTQAAITHLDASGAGAAIVAAVKAADRRSKELGV
jgi:pyrroline-5-carboxylate reductase